MAPDAARSELLELLGRPPEGPFPIDRAALLLAVDEYPELDFARYESLLNDYAGRVAARLSPADSDPRRHLAALRQVLFEEEGFHGNRDRYYDVRNSYLNQVLERRLGIPISLSAVVLGIGRRLGWPVAGVSFPGHFLVRYAAEPEVLAIDAFHGGLILGEEELQERWRAWTGADPPGRNSMLEPAEPRDVLVRMLNNIRMVHARERNYALAATALEKTMLLEPEVAEHRRDLGYFLLAARKVARAAQQLEHYLARCPHARDAETVREHLVAIRRVLDREV